MFNCGDGGLVILWLGSQIPLTGATTVDNILADVDGGFDACTAVEVALLAESGLELAETTPATETLPFELKLGATRQRLGLTSPTPLLLGIEESVLLLLIFKTAESHKTLETGPVPLTCAVSRDFIGNFFGGELWHATLLNSLFTLLTMTIMNGI